MFLILTYWERDKFRHSTENILQRIFMNENKRIVHSNFIDVDALSSINAC